jgi:hypothetical protein
MSRAVQLQARNSWRVPFPCTQSSGSRSGRREHENSVNKHTPIPSKCSEGWLTESNRPAIMILVKRLSDDWILCRPRLDLQAEIHISSILPASVCMLCILFSFRSVLSNKRTKGRSATGYPNHSPRSRCESKTSPPETRSNLHLLATRPLRFRQGSAWCIRMTCRRRTPHRPSGEIQHWSRQGGACR